MNHRDRNPADNLYLLDLPNHRPADANFGLVED